MYRVIRATTSASARRFGSLHDAGNYERKKNIYDQMYEILDRYGDLDADVTELFDSASKQDQKKLMDLAYQANE